MSYKCHSGLSQTRSLELPPDARSAGTSTDAADASTVAGANADARNAPPLSTTNAISSTGEGRATEPSPPPETLSPIALNAPPAKAPLPVADARPEVEPVEPAIAGEALEETWLTGDRTTANLIVGWIGLGTYAT